MQQSTAVVGLRPASRFAALAAGLMLSVALLPGLIAVPTVTLYLTLRSWISAGDTTSFLAANVSWLAVVLGFGAGLLAWLALGLIFSWSVDPARAASGIFRELQARYVLICARLDALNLTSIPADRQSAYQQALAMKAELDPVFDPTSRSTARLGSQWVSGTGYIAAWQRVHRAEEALMLLESDEQLVAGGLYDRGRLRGSSIAGRDDLMTQSAAAIAAVNECLMALLGWKAEVVPCGDMPRVVLVTIRRTINEYRDDLWEALVYLRRRVIQTLVFTGFTGYVGLILVLIGGASREAVIAGSAFYLAGALIGLLQAGYQEQRRRTAVEDYGLAASRLILLPLVAGIAGVIGAGLTAFLAAPPIGLNLLNDPDLSAAFSLQRYAIGLIPAAIFGLTPGLLLERIRALGDELKLGIAKSESGGTRTGPSREPETDE